MITLTLLILYKKNNNFFYKKNEKTKHKFAYFKNWIKWFFIFVVCFFEFLFFLSLFLDIYLAYRFYSNKKLAIKNESYKDTQARLKRFRENDKNFEIIQELKKGNYSNEVKVNDFIEKAKNF